MGSYSANLLKLNVGLGHLGHRIPNQGSFLVPAIAPFAAKIFL